MSTYTGSVYDADMRPLAILRADDRAALETGLAAAMAHPDAENARVWRLRRPTWPRHPELLRVYPPRAWGLPRTRCP